MPQDSMSLPGLFFDRVAQSGASIARRSRKDGTWVGQTWTAWGEVVRNVARGLMAFGIEPGQPVALLSNTRAEWTDSDFGIMTAGGLTVPIYPSSLSDQCAYIVQNSESVAVICEDQKQLDKILEVQTECPTLTRVFLIEGTPKENPTAADGKPLVVTWPELLARSEETTPEALSERTSAIDPNTLATIVYTSGTTGPPKGVMQTHANHVSAVKALVNVGFIRDDETDLIFLPLAHSFARAQSFGHVASGITLCYAESIDQLLANLAEVQPTLLFSVPRIYEKVYAKAQASAAVSPVKKKIFDWALRVGRAISQRQQQGSKVPFGLGLKGKVADRLVFSKLRGKLGGRVRLAVSGGAPLSREIAEFMHAAGILILEGYGLTETCPILTVNSPDAYRFGSVGKPIDGVEIKFAPDGEILGRGPNISLGYYKREEATKAVYLEDGWFATGDIGEFDADGFLKITDRKKDLIKTSGGKYVAPQEVENKLKVNPFVAQCMVHGDRRKFCSVVIVPNRERLEPWAAENGIVCSNYDDLIKHKKTIQQFERVLSETNQDLATYEQPKKFVLAAAEWTPETGELTPSMKVKRKVVTQKFQSELDALYDEKF
ncbi:MAG: AMP-dependent synthetase/ligase [Planctomycetota bacterium]